MTAETLSCTNDNNFSINIFKSGDFFTIPAITIQPNSSSNVQITFTQLNVGSYSGFIYSSDGMTTNINLNISDSSQSNPSGCIIDIFPTIMNNVKIQQGEKKVRNIQLSVPSCYNSSVNINGVNLQTDEQPIQLGELALGLIQPGNSILVPIDINAEGVSTGQYSDTLQFLIYDNKGNKINVPSVSVSVLVSQGISPMNNFSLSQLPTCSLDSITLNLNNTYKLTCSVSNPNIEVKPIIDSKYVKGVSVSESSTQYIYEFKAVLTGITSINAEYLYKNAPIGTPFSQEIKITNSGTLSIGGIDMKAEFYQGGVKKEIDGLIATTTVILATDNKTGNLINPFDLYLDGVKLNQTNIDLKSDKIYNIRVCANGYNDLIIYNLSVSQNQISYTISPQKNEYEQGEQITVNSSIANVSLLLNNYIVSNPIILNSPGNNTLQIVKEGYVSANITFKVNPSISLGSCTPIQSEWDKGKTIICSLTQNSSWEVFKDGALTDSGNGNSLEFKLTDYGNWEIKANNKYVGGTNLIKGSSWYNPFSWNLDYIKTNWFWFLIFGIFIVGGVYVFIKRKNNLGTTTPYS